MELEKMHTFQKITLKNNFEMDFLLHMNKFVNILYYLQGCHFLYLKLYLRSTDQTESTLFKTLNYTFLSKFMFIYNQIIKKIITGIYRSIGVFI